MRALAIALCLLVCAPACGRHPSSSLRQTLGLQNAKHGYGPGDCVTWPAMADRPASIGRTAKVDCGEPHRMELVGASLLPAGPYPAPDVLAGATADICAPMLALRSTSGTHVDTDRYHVVAIPPTADTWQRGDRTLWCGLESGDAAPPTEGRVLPPPRSG